MDGLWLQQKSLCGLYLRNHRAGGFAGIACPAYISETLRCRKLKLGRDIGWGCKYATLWCDVDLTFGLAIVTLTFKILSRLYLRNHKVLEVETL